MPSRVRADWAAPAHIHALTTCRAGGVSRASYGSASDGSALDGGALDGGASPAQRSGLNLGYTSGDDPDRVRENRQILRRMLPAEPHWLHQVHGREVLEFDSASPPLTVTQQRSPVNVADAAITMQASVVLCVLSADCLPIFMCNREGDAIGICHAGWRGLAAGVIEASALKLQQRRPASAGWIAHLGPAIGAAAFEVGDDVRSAFCDLHAADAQYFVPTTEAGKYLADLYKLASRRLHAAGFQTISGGAYCTVRDEQHFYSYRRDRQTGRMASLIWIQ